jgi:hypothetical protein
MLWELWKLRNEELQQFQCSPVYTTNVISYLFEHACVCHVIISFQDSKLKYCRRVCVLFPVLFILRNLTTAMTTWRTEIMKIRVMFFFPFSCCIPRPDILLITPWNDVSYETSKGAGYLRRYSVQQITGRPGFDPGRGNGYFSSPCVQTGSGAHPASYTIGTGGSFPGGKERPGRDADYSLPFTAKVENE